MNRFADTVVDARGNAPHAVKAAMARWWRANADHQGFARPTCAQLVAVEVALFDNPEVPGRTEARMVFELEVTKGASCALLGVLGA